MLKKTFFILIVVASGLKQSHSQSWAAPGAHWYYNYSLMGCCSGYVEIIYINDSLVNGKICSVLQKIKHSYNTNTQITSISNMGHEYIYSNSNRVYRYKNGNFYKVYDFNLQPSDSMQFYWDGGTYQCDTIGVLRVDSVGTTIINSDTLQFQKVSIFDDYNLTWEYYPYRILERIGSLGFMFHYRYSCSNLIVDGDVYDPLRCYYDSLLGFYDNGVSASCNYIYTGVNDIYFSNSISLSPNPAINNLQLAIGSWQGGKMEIEVFDVMGKQVFKSQVKSQKEEINVSDFPRGVYYLQISSDRKSAVKKFVKM